jgi:hypothetical protein
MFRGSDVGNFDKVDGGKVQMFWFTLLLGVGYGAACFTLIEGAEVNTRLAQLPAISEGLAALLALSHAGYLANEATPREGE